MGSIAYLSYEKKSELMELMTSVPMPRSTVHYQEKTLADDYLAKKEKEIADMIKELGIEPEGVYHYDEQVLWVNTNLKLRMTIIDADNNLIINEDVVDSEDFEKDTIKKFLKKSLKGLELKAIITDGHKCLSFHNRSFRRHTSKMHLPQNANINEKSRKNSAKIKKTNKKQ
jgi:hypothetical protein